jgi:iron complex transport system substrate-binding protein
MQKTLRQFGLLTLALFALEHLALGQEAEFPVKQVAGFPPFVPESVQLEIISQSEDTIRVKHVFGETNIPANPQRIFVSDTALLDSLLSLDIRPVGVGHFATKLPLALQDVAAGIPQLRDVGFGGEVNLEELAELKPDLIFTGLIDENLYKLYNNIAPTVSLATVDWRELTPKLTALFGKTEKAEAVATDYEARMTSYREQLREMIPEGETLTILLLFGSDMYLYTPGYVEQNTYHPSVVTFWAYGELGFPASPEVIALGGSEFYASVSLELIPELKADHIVIFPRAYGDDEPGEGLDTYLTSPLWQTVPAVQQGNVYVLSADVPHQGYYVTPYLIEEFLRVLEEAQGQSTQ